MGDLNADMGETGWSWPDTIQRPAAFLTYRLGRIADRLASATPPQGGVAASHRSEEPAEEELASTVIHLSRVLTVAGNADHGVVCRR